MASGMIPKEQVDQVAAATDIVALVSGYVQLKNAGKNLTGLCPFHNERSPSFVVTPARQSYHCFGCGVHGDPIRFLMEIENLPFVDSVERLAEQAGIALNRKSKGAVPKVTDGLVKALEDAFHYYRNALANAGEGSKIWNYLKDRNLSPEMVEKFQLGYIGPGWTQMFDHLSKKGFSEKQLLATGLVKEGEKGGVYDRLRDRLLFPLRDVQGRLLGFAGRSLGDDLPKYLNPPETELYKKSQGFYGAFQARDSIRKSGKVLLVEGYMDAIRLSEQGWPETVAACGTALNDGHIQALKRLGSPELVILMDGDKAGIKAAYKSATLCLEKGLDSKVLVLPDGLDPDDFFRSYEPTDFANLLNKAPSDYQYLLGAAKGSMEGLGLEAQRKVIDDLVSMAKNMTSPIKRDLVYKEIAETFGLNPQSFGVTQNTVKQAPAAEARATQAPRQILTAPARLGQGFLQRFPEESQILVFLFSEPLEKGKITDWVKVEYFEQPELKALYRRMIQIPLEDLVDMRAIDFADLFSEYSGLIMELLDSAKGYTLEAKILAEKLIKKVRKNLPQKIRMAQSQGDEKLVLSLLQEQKEVTALIRQLDPRNPTTKVR
ncbi:MAG: DNA primase [SAR324 cluster bacterium]|nr:DNA primase [SAR324 cluster bacterium]